MKKYVIDKLCLLLVGIGLVIFIPHMCYHIWILVIAFEIMTILSVGYLCKSIIFLPLDLILGKQEEIIVFKRVDNVQEYEFFRNTCFCEWIFNSRNGTVILINPVAMKEEEIYAMEQPLHEQKVRIYYYRYSKILCSWEALN